jgi:hypothetical protein
MGVWGRRGAGFDIGISCTLIGWLARLLVCLVRAWCGGSDG